MLVLVDEHRSAARHEQFGIVTDRRPHRRIVEIDYMTPVPTGKYLKER